MNRLNDAYYQKPQSNIEQQNSYNESLTYDKNGNIITLDRYGNYDTGLFAYQIDDLDYRYADKSNLLVKVTDAANAYIGFIDDSDGTVNGEDDYKYDANGNMVKDNNKGISKIIYNHLNLPTQIEFSGSGTIFYFYNAAGVKLKKEVHAVLQTNEITTTDYLGGFQYENTVLQFFPHPEGYVKNTPDKHGNPTYDYIYNYTDHLGNIRLSYTLDPVTNVLKILEENHYYPFGLKHTNYSSDRRSYIPETDLNPKLIVPVVEDSYKYKYNGKEWQDELGLNVTAMDFRMYDNALGRFHNIDAMTEIMPSLSPYRFAFNNPVIWKDPSGLSETSDVVEEHWDLDEVVVTAKARKSYHNTRPADFGTYHLAKGLNTERFKGTLQQYNKTFGTDFKNYDDWYYRALYVPFRNEMINDMHSAQAKAGQAIMLLVGSVFAAPILAASPAITSAISVVATNPVVQQNALNMTLNAGSQYIANGGVAGDINRVEVITSGIPGTNVIPTIIGESVSWTGNKGFNGPDFDSPGKWAAQVVGGLISNRFAKATDTHLKGEGVGGAIVGHYYKFMVETTSNTVPNVIK